MTPREAVRASSGIRIKAAPFPKRPVPTRTLAVALLTLGAACPGSAYFQDQALEAALRRSESRALALLPAKGFSDGAAGFFTTHELYVVPESERAWCQDRDRSVLKPGCYIEFFFQGNGRRARSSNGDFCGLPGRWYKAPGAKRYVPTAGAFYSQAIANDDSEAVDSAVDDESSLRCR